MALRKFFDHFNEGTFLVFLFEFLFLRTQFQRLFHYYSNARK
ncbi:hypothetical protein LEP1GSC186_4505 [Leptospira noguchii serovar Autumnalis str. ZUN142]|uniref:Uncharacterized protein n=2 Tax=Leptospira noguchii TaxID=28182 RepID=M6U6K2_9LEPT|nr:hypothetical protein LEP1GSC035_4137 [Leptospira noguchii str. 2007001578]EMO40652.1 hypothetical protein LEP1GSC186_4505 [Leptospira noguchii serovar Autumnalis str. ZUN142]